MPTYDYECEACGLAFERWQEMSARKLRTCPKCGKRKLIRLVGAGAGVIFRGSGFYETDYKRKESKPASTSKGTSSSASEGSASSGSSKEATAPSGGSPAKGPGTNGADTKGSGTPGSGSNGSTSKA